MFNTSNAFKRILVVPLLQFRHFILCSSLSKSTTVAECVIDTGLFHYFDNCLAAHVRTTIRMYLGAYILPKIIGLSIVEIIGSLVSSVIILNCIQFPLFHLKDKYIHLVLRQIKILEPVPNNMCTDNEPQSLLHGFLIPRLYVYVLALYFLFMLNGAGFVFFDVFLYVDVAFSCESSATGSECFSSITNKPIDFADQPIDCKNDSLIVLPDNATLTCYKYNLDIGEAAGIAGGMITISMLIIKFITGCFLFLKRHEPNKDRQPCKHCYRAMLICLTLTCQALIVIMFIVIFSVSKLRNRLATLRIVLQFLNFFGAIFIAVTVPCFDFIETETPINELENEEIEEKAMEKASLINKT